MSEYIDREKIEYHRNYEKDGAWYAYKAEIKKIPAADVVPVVRCKDCIHKVTTNGGEYNPQDIVCDYWYTDGLEDNGFCYNGVNGKYDESENCYSLLDEKNEEETMIELKPCPFCGSAALLDHIPVSGGCEIYRVKCTNEACKVTTFCEEEKLAAVAVWSRRIYSEDGVTCSECEHFHEIGSGYGECNKFGLNGIVVRLTDFCSYARKRGKSSE